jgi:hypothetical protein
MIEYPEKFFQIPERHRTEEMHKISHDSYLNMLEKAIAENNYYHVSLWPRFPESISKSPDIEKLLHEGYKEALLTSTANRWHEMPPKFKLDKELFDIAQAALYEQHKTKLTNWQDIPQEHMTEQMRLTRLSQWPSTWSQLNDESQANPKYFEAAKNGWLKGMWDTSKNQPSTNFNYYYKEMQPIFKKDPDIWNMVYTYFKNKMEKTYFNPDYKNEGNVENWKISLLETPKECRTEEFMQISNQIEQRAKLHYEEVLKEKQNPTIASDSWYGRQK